MLIDEELDLIMNLYRVFKYERDIIRKQFNINEVIVVKKFGYSIESFEVYFVKKYFYVSVVEVFIFKVQNLNFCYC